MILYKITNKLNGKCYIGQTIRSLSRRWTEHKNGMGKNSVLWLAIKKYGNENFSVEELAIYSNLEDLNNAEEYYIDYFNCIAPNGYNLRYGGNNKPHSTESRNKMSISRKGKHNSTNTEFKKGSIPHNKGKKLSMEIRQQMSLSRKGTRLGPKHPFYGKKHSEATKLKMSLAKQKKD